VAGEINLGGSRLLAYATISRYNLPMITVVVPNLNGKRWLGACLESLQQQTEPAEVIVVDNGSTDGSVAMVASDFPRVTCLELTSNQGFTGGVNTGIAYALKHDAEFVALFNNDAVAEADWLKQLLATARQRPQAGIVTGKLLRFDQRHLDGTGDQYTIWGLPYPRGRDELDRGQYDQEGPVFAGSGGASLYRSEMLRQIGLFDQAFFAYYEDVDVGFRAQLAGWKVYYQPHAVAYHRTGATSSQMGSFARYHTIKNCYYLYVKDMPARLFWKYLPAFALGMFMIAGNSLLRGQVVPLAKAYARLVVTLPAMVAKRRRVQRSRTVDVTYIESLLSHHLPPTHRRLRRWRRLVGARP